MKEAMLIWIVSLAASPSRRADVVPATIGGPSNAAGTAALASLPLAFVENRGQWDAPARFAARRGGMVAWLGDGGLTLDLSRRERDDRIEGVVVRLVFEGALETVALEGEGEQPGIWNFFLGNDPEEWRAGVRGYASVLYRGLQEGVDLRLREEGGRLEYDVILAPGADPARLVVRCEGTAGLEVDPDGSLAMRTALGPIRHSRPVTWQVLPDGARIPIEARFRLLGPDRFGFEVPGLDPSLALVIDPGLLYSTFLGGLSYDYANALALDASGAATVAGRAGSSNFPATAGAYDTTFDGIAWDAFVTRLSPSGGSLVYSSFLGGTFDDFANAVALDASGAATVAGYTVSGNYPTTAGAFDTTLSGVDAFVTRLSPSGGSLLYSTLLGGVLEERGEAIALDASGAATVAGWTESANFPATAGAYDTTFAGVSDAFVTRLAPSGASLDFSTFLGGTGSDVAQALALDATGAAIVAGDTYAFGGFPTTAGAFDTTLNGGLYEAYVARVSPSGGSLLYSTFLGAPATPNALAVDASGAATAAGGTGSPSFPTTAGAFDTTHNGGVDAFVMRLSPSGASLLYSTFLGGGATDAAHALALGASGAVAVVGETVSTNFPATAGALDTTFNGGFFDAFAARLSPSGGSLVYSTYLGGSMTDDARGLALDASGAATVAGSTESPDLPTTSGAYDTTHNDLSDALVARLDLLPAGAGAYGASTPGCAGPLPAGVSSWPQVGNAAFAFTCGNAPASAPGLLALSVAPLAAPLALLGVDLWIDPAAPVLLLFLVQSDAIGAASVPMPIPAIPGLAGGQVFVQFLWLGPSAPSPPCPALGVSASNALGVTVQP